MRRQGPISSRRGRHHGRAPGFPLVLAATTVTALSLGVLLAGVCRARAAAVPHPPDSAPGRTAKRALFGNQVVSGRTVTIARPREEVYAFWRDFSNLARVMDAVDSVEPGPDDSWIWRLAGPVGTRFTLITRIVHEREGEVLSWKSTEDSEIASEGKIEFRDAPGGRGTEVTALVSWRPPAGRLGRFAAQLMRLDPATTSRHELKRVKMLLETGEIATARNTRPRQEAPAALSVQSAR